MTCSMYLSNDFIIVENIFLTNETDRKEENVLYNDTFNTFCLWLYGVRHMVKDHSNSKRRNLLPPHGLVLPISSNGSFICTILQTG